MANYCEDYPCCGHTPSDPCDPRSAISEPWYCDQCGYMHYGVGCDSFDDWDEDECDPANSYCAYDDADCETCREYWLDFHADGMREDEWLDGSYEE